jgi:subtilisin family serine protease
MTGSQRLLGRTILLAFVLLSSSIAWGQQQLSPPTLILDIDIESINAPDALADVIMVLHSEGLLSADDLTELVVKKGQTAEEILKEKYQLPAVTPKLKQALEALNPQFRTRGLQNLWEGDVIKVPIALTRVRAKRVFSPDQRSEYERLAENLPSILRRALKKAAPDLELPLWGYNLQIETIDTEAARRAVAALRDLDAQGIRSSLAPAERLADPPRYAGLTPANYWQACIPDDGTLGEAPYAALLPWLTDWAAEPLPSACVDPANWPQVILLDQLIFAHTELSDSQGRPIVKYWDSKLSLMQRDAVASVFDEARQVGIALEGTPLESRPNGKYRCRSRQFDDRFDHGTHLAGIIASRGDGAGFKGLLPSMTLVSINDRKLGNSAIKKLVRELTDRSEDTDESQRIMVYASAFPKEGPGEDHASNMGALLPNYPKEFLNGAKLKDGPNVRLEHPVARAVFEDTGALWIVAAGQHKVKPEETPDPVRLEPQTPQAPQNLGDQAHVVVVTACADCGGTDATAMLWPNANKAADGHDEAVAIAAPGVNIPGPVVGAAYAEASGTSEAAAFVAGVTAAMYSCHPNAYKTPSKVKTQLILTGRPYLLRDGSPEISPIVIIDPQMALRNPGSDWLVEGPFGGGAPQGMMGEPQPIDVKGWCLEQLPIVDAHGKDYPLVVSEIRRLIRRGSKWVAFKKKEGLPFGPFNIELDDPQTAILKTSQETIKLGALGDILLSSPRGLTSCDESDDS